MADGVWTASEIVANSGVINTLRVGKREQWNYTRLDNSEQAKLNKFFLLSEKYLSHRSKYLYYTFKRQEKLIEKWTMVVKALLNGPTFGGVDPNDGEFGITLAFPQLIKYSTTTPVLWDTNKWTVTIADSDVGTTKYLFGNATTYYKGNSTEDQRTELLILEDGLYMVGDKPFFTQYKMEFEGKPYNVYKASTVSDLPWYVFDETISDGHVSGVDSNRDRELLIYPIDFPFAVFIPHNYGFKMTILPERAGTFDLRILGVVWYEYDAFKDLTWVS